MGLRNATQLQFPPSAITPAQSLATKLHRGSRFSRAALQHKQQATSLIEMPTAQQETSNKKQETFEN